ncbi:MAG: hypothetical protein AUJ57_09055 [Zetaproteobacteria bacterium CG1_02_53_45]|nr:MAG: hypothetical protein AUJ57_09055 [Zetaproteobacteria bacterium CG1_02_53_45]
MLKLITVISTLMLFCNPAAATEWQATQGDVVKVETSAVGSRMTLQCFGRNWPVKQNSDGQWRGWIGVDLKKDPGVYNITWSNAAATVGSDQLHVKKGEFRISHIQVEKKMAEFDAKTLARINREAKALKATYVTPVDANPEVHMTGRPVEGIESTPFGAQRYVNNEPRSPHSGIDIAAPAGTPIITPLAGTVLYVADMYLNGKTVAIGHGNGLVSVYSHMQSTAAKPGQWVVTHQEIGKVGATGRATGPHLHWGVRFYNARVNPETLL